MQVIIDEKRTPVYNEVGQLVAYRVDRFYVDRPGVSPPAPAPRPAAAPAPLVVTTQAAPAPRRQAVSTPQPVSGFQLECYVAPDTFKEVIKIQRARREWQAAIAHQAEASTATPARWYTPAPNTFQLVLERNRARA